jgi:exopolysaccharide biosynthesis polyprenyl glycosylphosphotransferase
MAEMDSKARWREEGERRGGSREAAALIFARYVLAGLMAVAALWLVMLTPSPLTIALVCLIVGFVAAAVVLEREPLIRGVGLSQPIDWTREEVKPLRALIVGAGSVGRALAKSLEAQGRYEVVGFVDDQFELSPDDEWPLLGGRDATAALVKDFNIDEVFLAYVPTWQQRLVEDLTAHHPEVVVQVVPSPYEAMMQLGKVQSMGEVAVIQLTGESAPASDLLKRTFDVFASLALGLVFAVPMLLIALIIKLSSPGPVIFAQDRVGRYGLPFTLYKFRTMVEDAEADTGPVLSPGESDARLTPIGRIIRKTRMDELPQIWNILKGEMSLVGPRPERSVFVRQFERALPNYSRRHLVRPGMTGLAQVCAGYHTDHRDKLRFDLIYVTQHTIWMDLSILIRTLRVVFQPSRD